MSSIRVVNQTIHYVRYGRHDAEQGTAWIRFWREAVCFEVSIVATRIQNTPFHGIFVQALQELDKSTSEHRKDWVVKWEAFCDCIIRYILPELEILAKDGYKGGRVWITLEDYLQTPLYKLSLRPPDLGDNTQDAVVQIDEGPLIRAALDLTPVPLHDLSFSIPGDLPAIKASDLKVAGHAKDVRQNPSKVRTLDGNSMYLIAATRLQANESGSSLSQKLESMSSYLAFDRLLNLSDLTEDERRRFPQSLAIVKSIAASDESTGMNGPNKSPDKELFVGLLVEFLPHARRLSDRTTLELLAFCKKSDEVVSQLENDLRSMADRLHSQSPPIGHGGMGAFRVMVTPRPRTSWIDFDLEWHIVAPRVGNGTDSDLDPIGADEKDLEKLLGPEGWLRKELNRVKQDRRSNELSPSIRSLSDTGLDSQAWQEVTLSQ